VLGQELVSQEGDIAAKIIHVNNHHDHPFSIMPTTSMLRGK
jgi:hypothetical protein